MQDVYFTFSTRSPGESKNVYDITIEQLDGYFTPQVNVHYERHLFRTMTKLITETVDQFVTRLREKADCCEFGEATDENIRDQLIEKCSSSQLRRKLLERGRGLTLSDLQTIARAMEASVRQTGSMETLKENQASMSFEVSQIKVVICKIIKCERNVKEILYAVRCLKSNEDMILALAG